MAGQEVLDWRTNSLEQNVRQQAAQVLLRQELPVRLSVAGQRLQARRCNLLVAVRSVLGQQRHELVEQPVDSGITKVAAKPPELMERLDPNRRTAVRALLRRTEENALRALARVH